MSTRRVVMLIADIGGYTDYMQFHRSFLGHAEAATKRMLDKVVKAARGFDLIEIEGDAAFLSRDVEGLDGPATLNAVTSASRRRSSRTWHLCSPRGWTVVPRTSWPCSTPQGRGCPSSSSSGCAGGWFSRTVASG